MTHTITVGVDGEAAHRGAVDWSAARVAESGAQLVLVTVIERPWGDGEHPARQLVSAAEALLAAERVNAERTTDTVTTRIAHGGVAQELVRASGDAELLVVGSRTGVERGRAFAGSLGVRVAAAAPCPVAVIPHDWRPAGSGVVVGVDGELPSEVAVAFAADEAARLRERLHIVCVGYTANPLLAGFVPERSLGDHRQRIVDAAARRARDQHSDVDVTTEVIEAAPARGLVDAARGARMLVLGTHGRHGVRRLMLGSVSHDVLLNLQTPIVIAKRRPEGRESEERSR